MYRKFKQHGLLIVLVFHLVKTKKKLENLCKQGIQVTFTKMTLIDLIFSMTWLMPF